MFQYLCHLRLQVREWRAVLSSKVGKERHVLVAVDEAHCISEWFVFKATKPIAPIKVHLFHRGQDFRTAFKMIGGLRALVRAPFMALSASAPPDIQAEIIESLDLNSPVIISRDLNRPNILFR